MPGTSIFHIITSSSCLIEYEKQLIELRVGDFIFIPKGQGIFSVVTQKLKYRICLIFHVTRLVGEPMLQYLTKWRMNLAVMRLKNGEKVTPEFIEQLGYKSEAAFRRTFKKVIGKNTNEFQIS